jgi:DNA topoisomerase-2
LITKLNTSNMHLYDINGKLKKYDTVDEILREYYEYRLETYVLRKKYYTKVLENKLNIIKWRIKFLEYYDTEKIVLKKGKTPLTHAEVEEQLVKHQFPKLSHNFEDVDKKYDYLTDLKIWDLTLEKKTKLEENYNDITMEFETYINTTVQQIWLSELDEIEKEHVMQMQDFEANKGTGGEVQAGKKKRVTKKK